MQEEKELSARDISSTTNIIFTNCNGEDMRNWVSNLVFKFNNDPMVNESGIIVLLRYVWVYAIKIEDFEKGRKENKFERNRECRDIS